MQIVKVTNQFIDGNSTDFIVPNDKKKDYGSVWLQEMTNRIECIAIENTYTGRVNFTYRLNLFFLLS